MGECHECIDYHQCIMGTSVGSALWIYLANLTNFTNLAFLAYFTNLGYLANFTNSGYLTNTRLLGSYEYVE